MRDGKSEMGLYPNLSAFMSSPYAKDSLKKLLAGSGEDSLFFLSHTPVERGGGSQKKAKSRLTAFSLVQRPVDVLLFCVTL